MAGQTHVKLALLAPPLALLEFPVLNTLVQRANNKSLGSYVAAVSVSSSDFLVFPPFPEFPIYFLYNYTHLRTILYT